MLGVNFTCNISHKLKHWASLVNKEINTKKETKLYNSIQRVYWPIDGHEVSSNLYSFKSNSIYATSKCANIPMNSMKIAQFYSWP